MKKFFKTVGIIALLASSSVLNAQVTIGQDKIPETFSVLELVSNKDKGLRLPQLTTAERNTITTAAFKANDLATGLIIENITTGCLEYWNHMKWVSLCAGTANISFKNAGGNSVDPTQPPFPGVDDPNTGNDELSRGPFYPTDEPPCGTLDPAYDFLVVSGSAYFHIFLGNTATGEFTVSMGENNSVNPRTAILRVTNNCTNEYKEFVFTQEGNTTLCQPGANAPVINAPNGLQLCTGGAVYMELTGASAGVDYIWTLAGVEKGRGTSFIAKQSGTYTVYAGGIGCTTPTPAVAVVTTSATSAPSPVAIIVGQNSGYVCSPGSATKIYAYTPASGTLMWFKDGVHQQGIIQTVSGSQTYIEAGIGVWFAAVDESTCSSTQSNEITVALDPSAGVAIAEPAFTINGQPNSAPVVVCQGGSLLLAVTSPNAAYTYSWYVNNILKGSGTTYELSMAGISGSFILQCRASGNSQCASAGVAQINVSTGFAPAIPIINNGASSTSICGSAPAVLNASGGGSAGDYKWYRDDVEIGGATAAVYNTTTPGNYTVRMKNASGCWSAISSNTVNVINNGAISLAWAVAPASADAVISTSKSYSVAASPTPDSYTWVSSNTNAATVTPIGNGSSAIVNYLASGSTTITVSATNACGTVQLASATLTVVQGCTPVTAATLSPSGTIAKLTTDGPTVFSANASNGSAPYTYEFFVGGVSQGPASAANTFSLPATAGTRSVSAKVYNTCTTSGLSTATTTVTYSVPVVIPVGAGSGSLTGKTCFDIAENTCDGVLASSRAANKANFSQVNTYRQAYTFTSAASGTVQNVRYVIVDTENTIDSHSGSGFTAGNFGNNAKATITINFKRTLNSSSSVPLIQNRDRDAAANVIIYVIYNDGSKDVEIHLGAKIQDCACCGAYVAANVWKEFMCHNLGANQALDAFTPAQGINGDYYQWGGKLPVKTMANDGNNTAENGNSWGTTVLPNQWYGNNTTGTNVKVKSVHDPCPIGFRVPSHDEWDYLRQNNTKTSVPSTWNNAANPTNWQGMKFGSSLYLPAAGTRGYNTGTLHSRGSSGDYWTTRGSSGAYAYYFYFDKFGTGMNTYNRRHGLPVRCIVE